MHFLRLDHAEREHVVWLEGAFGWWPGRASTALDDAMRKGDESVAEVLRAHGASTGRGRQRVFGAMVRMFARPIDSAFSLSWTNAKVSPGPFSGRKTRERCQNGCGLRRPPMRTPSFPSILAGTVSLLLLGTVGAQSGEIVQTGSIFTGVIQGNRTFQVPIAVTGYSGEQELAAVEVRIDVRMSGEYTIQPTPLPPNGIVAAHSTTTLTLGQDVLGNVEIDFAPIPWVFPVAFPLNILWALDGSDLETLTDESSLAAFESNGSTSRR